MGELVKVMLWSWCCCGSGLCGSIRLTSKSKSWIVVVMVECAVVVIMERGT